MTNMTRLEKLAQQARSTFTGLRIPTEDQPIQTPQRKYKRFGEKEKEELEQVNKVKNEGREYRYITRLLSKIARKKEKDHDCLLPVGEQRVHKTQDSNPEGDEPYSKRRQKIRKNRISRLFNINRNKDRTSGEPSSFTNFRGSSDI